jgi:hypothetical protein
MAYVANYESGKKPYICKVITASSGEEFHVALNYSNDSERLEMSSELIYEHLQNCIRYIQDLSQGMAVIAVDEPVNGEPWPLKGWADLEWTNNEINLWWNYIYYKEGAVPESSPVELALEIDSGPAINEDGSPHVHEDGEEHTHA